MVGALGGRSENVCVTYLTSRFVSQPTATITKDQSNGLLQITIKFQDKKLKIRKSF